MKGPPRPEGRMLRAELEMLGNRRGTVGEPGGKQLENRAGPVGQPAAVIDLIIHRRAIYMRGHVQSRMSKPYTENTNIRSASRAL